ncbi:MAG: TlpA family protein disulfide reductase [Thioalkalivibrio sp.]|nr:TlpA family protein disulfide reductase [Thioalkalivibrio sp.]
MLAVLLCATDVLAQDPPPSATLLAREARAKAALEIYGVADFTWRIRALDGEATTLESFRGDVLFINVWASWCAPCVRELGSIERLQARLSDTDVRFLIVAAEGERPVRRFLRRYRYDLPFYLEEARMPRAFGLRGLPTSWVVDREGHIVLLRHGEAVWDTQEVEAFVRAVAGGA